MRLTVLSAVLLFLSLSMPRGVHAAYVLPYPSFMPGNKLYRVTRVLDTLKEFWFWGNIAKVRYHLNLSDKYLVESKTLFEYKQYLLASDALARSDIQAGMIMPFIGKASAEGKDVRVLKETVRDAMAVHETVLGNMESVLPSEFTWRPEKGESTDLPISDMLERSLRIREEVRTAASADTKPR